jgi:hypothetical protein
VLDIIFIIHLCKEVGCQINLLANIVFEDNWPVIDLTKTLSSKDTWSKHFWCSLKSKEGKY